MYLVAGMVARSVAGPGVILSFIIAAVASIFSGKSSYKNYHAKSPVPVLPSSRMKSFRSINTQQRVLVTYSLVHAYCIVSYSQSVDRVLSGNASRIFIENCQNFEAILYSTKEIVDTISVLTVPTII
jgi:hypothetical protein